MCSEAKLSLWTQQLLPGSVTVTLENVSSAKWSPTFELVQLLCSGTPKMSMPGYNLS